MGTATRRRERVARWAVAAGVLVMVAASLLAPPQPELWQDGASCEVSLCGTLEDPPRYAAAVTLWLVGAAVAALGTPFAVRAGERPRPLLVVLGVLVSPFLLAGLGLLAFLVSLWTSAPGGWTVLCGGALALLARGAGQVRRVAAGRTAGFGTPRVLA